MPSPACDYVARPGSCGKPPGALYVESGEEQVLSFSLLTWRGRSVRPAASAFAGFGPGRPGDPPVLHHEAHRGRLAVDLEAARGRAVEPHGRDVSADLLARASTLATSSAPWTGASAAAASPPPSAIRTTSGAMTSSRDLCVARIAARWLR